MLWWYCCVYFVYLLLCKNGLRVENIIRKIRMYYPVSDEALEALVCLFERCVFPAKTIIVRVGELDRNVYFIERGIARSYILHDGKEITTWFSKEGDATCGSWDLYHRKAGFEYVETLEETIAYAVAINKLDGLYEAYIDIANWMRVLQQENFLQLQDTHICRLALPAKERYRHFMEVFPDLHDRINLRYIASFLGITQQSLSRIRAEGGF